MSIRINVTAVRDCPATEVEAVFAQTLKPCAGGECVRVQTNEHGGWVSFTSSVWGVSASDLNRGLCKLARPALQFTTSDGERWYLTVHGGPEGQRHFMHEYWCHSRPVGAEQDAEMEARLHQPDETPPCDPRVAFLEDDPPPGSDRPKGPFDLIANQLGVPEDFRASVAPLPYSQALNRYREWHADQVCAALTAAGIPHDSDAVKKALLWETVTDNERDGDLGNLPRLLSVLGLGGEWDQFVSQAEAPPEPEPMEAELQAIDQGPPPEPPKPEDNIGPVLKVIEAFALTPVAGGPVSWSLADMTLIRFFVESCSDIATAGVVVTVGFPPGFDAGKLQPPEGAAPGIFEITPTGFRFGLHNHIWLSEKDIRNQLGEDWGRLFYDLPDGATLECAFAHESQAAINQRYRGVVSKGVWHIEATYPAIPHDVLRDALQLSNQWGQERLKCRDEMEAKALVAAAKHDSNLQHMTVNRTGATVYCEWDIVSNLSKVLFRMRYRNWWNVAAVEAELAERRRQELEMERQMRRACAEATRKRAAPHVSAVLFEGKHSRFWQSDFTLLAELEEETREKFDGDLAALEFHHVGDLVAKKQRDVVLRVSIAADHKTFAVLSGKRTMYLGYEFYSRFADGSTLTTTSNAAHDSLPEVNVYVKVCVGHDAVALHAKHRWGIERFQSRKGTTPIALEPTLEAVAREIDMMLGRRG